MKNETEQRFKNDTENNTYQWLLKQFNENQISFPDLEDTQSKKPDFSVALNKEKNLIIECKGIESKRLHGYRKNEWEDKENLGKFSEPNITTQDQNLFGKFEQYSQLKTAGCGNEEDIRILMLGGQPTYIDNSWEIAPPNGPPRLSFLMDAIYGTQTQFTLYSNSSTKMTHVGTYNTAPAYISAIGFICIREKNGYNPTRHLFVRFFVNENASIPLDTEIFRNKSIFNALIWPIRIITKK